MATRAQIIIPIAAAAFIVGIVGVLNIPSDAKLESTEFPMGTIKLDDKILQVQIADNDSLRIRGLMFQEELPYDQGCCLFLTNLVIVLCGCLTCNSLLMLFGLMCLEMLLILKRMFLLV